MCGPLLLALITIPAIEIWVIIEIGARIGPLATLLLIFFTAAAGLATAHKQSLATLDKLRAGELAADVTALQAPLILLAALCLLIPGFVTDLAGALLLIPPIRAAAARAIIRRYSAPRRPRAPHHPGADPGLNDPGLDPGDTIIVVRRRD